MEKLLLLSSSPWMQFITLLCDLYLMNLIELITASYMTEWAGLPWPTGEINIGMCLFLMQLMGLYRYTLKLCWIGIL